MGNQLFYTYSSNIEAGSYLAQSVDAIVNTHAYSYSLVFDTTRRTIWAQEQEYGGIKIAYQSDQPVNDNIPTDRCITFVGNNNTQYTIYVNDRGELAIDGWEPIKITSFTVCNANRTEIPAANRTYAVGDTLQSEIAYFKFDISGTGLVRQNGITSCTLTSNYAVNSANYPATSPGTTYTPPENSWTNSNIRSNANGNTLASFTASNELTLKMTLHIEDARGNTDTKTIDVAKLVYPIYYGVSATESDFRSRINNYSADNDYISKQIFGNIASQNIQTGNDETNLYFWVFIPSAKAVSRCVMYNGSFVAEWDPTYSGEEVNGYRIWRSPLPNIGGANFRVEIN